MAELPEVFNPSEEPTIEDGFQPVPAAWYQARIVKSDWKTNAKKTGGYIELDFLITDGEYEGRTIRTRYNIVNPNNKTVQIAKRQISSLCEALDIEESFSDTEVLHDIPLAIEAVVKPGAKGYPDQNDIKKYASIENAPISDDDDIPFD